MPYDGPNFDCCSQFNDCVQEMKCLVHKNKALKKGGIVAKEYRQKCNFYRNTISLVKPFRDVLLDLQEKGIIKGLQPTKKLNKLVETKWMKEMGLAKAMALCLYFSQDRMGWAVSGACKTMEKLGIDNS